MTNFKVFPNSPAYPELHIHHFLSDSDGKDKPAVVPRFMGGLTKREYFAAMAMLGHQKTYDLMSYQAIAESCVKQADALIEELNK
jgi:hypothetical protein